MYKSLPPKSNKEQPENVYSIFCENDGVEFINIARILRDPEKVMSFPTFSLKFLMPMVT